MISEIEKVMLEYNILHTKEQLEYYKNKLLEHQVGLDKAERHIIAQWRFPELDMFRMSLLIQSRNNFTDNIKSCNIKIFNLEKERNISTNLIDISDFMNETS